MASDGDPVQTFPPQGWAHRDGLVKLQPNGVALQSDDLRDRLMIHEAFARWGIAFDEVQLDVVASLFTQDGVYEVCLGRRQADGRVEGREAIARNVGAVLAQQRDQRRHAISNVVIDRLTADEATAMAYGLVTAAADGLALSAAVIYSAQLRKEADGVWRFSHFVIGMDAYLGQRPRSGVTPPRQ